MIATNGGASCSRTKSQEDNIGVFHLDKFFVIILAEIDSLDFDIRTLSEGKSDSSSICEIISLLYLEVLKIGQAIPYLKLTP